MQTTNTSKIKSNGNIRIGSKKKDPNYKNLKNNINAVGILQPISVVKDDKGNFVVIDGHQRLEIAKELKFEDVPYVIVSNKLNREIHQVSVNMHHVPTTLFETIKVIENIVEKDPNISHQKLSEMLGRNIKWVKKAAQLTNLIDELKTKDILKESNESSLVNISFCSIEKQKEAYEKLYDKGYQDYSIDLIASELDNGASFERIKSVVPEKVFRKYEKAVGITHTYANSLFSEYAKEQFHSDPDFLRDVFLNETDLGKKVLSDITINSDLEPWYHNNVYSINMDCWNSLNKFYRKSKDFTDKSFKDIEIIEWNGNVFRPVIKYKVLSNDKSPKTDTDEKPQASVTRTINAFCKAIYPSVLKHLEKVDLTHKTKDLNTTFRWLIDNGNLLSFNYLIAEKIRDNKFTNENIIELVTLDWYSEFFDRMNYNEFDQLLSIQKLDSIRVIVENKFKDNFEFRKDILNAYTVSELTPLLNYPDKYEGKTKTDLVQFLAERMKTLPFDDIWKNLSSAPISKFNKDSQ